MVTIYDLLEVAEDASKEEIEKSYRKMVLEYRQDPKFSDEENRENEMIMNKVKIAYEILSNDEKRKKYDADLSKKRAEELLKNVSVKKEQDIAQDNITKAKEPVKPQSEIDRNDKVDDYEVELTADEQAKVRKAAQEEFKKNLKKAKMVEEEYNNAYNKAYNEYMKKNSYSQNGARIKGIIKSIIFIFVLIIIIFIILKLPPVQDLLADLYEKNDVVRIIVDIVKSLFGN